MARTAWRQLDPLTALGRVIRELALLRGQGDRAALPRAFKQADSAVVRRVPPWVGRAALLKSYGTWWLWCEPRARPKPGGPAQLVLDLPPGRYMVDTLDAGVHAWIARESAAAAPLVVGLPAAASPVLVRIRRRSGSTARPQE